MTHQGRRLVLIRHSLPEMVSGVPASTWHLSREGRLRCERLAKRLVGSDLSAVFSSEESKAAETGRIVADSLGLPFETWPGLHEHERGVVESLGDRENFRIQVAAFFERPAQLVMGYETADQAHARIADSISTIVGMHPAGSLAIVSHGTVMALFVSRACRVDAFAFWTSLGLPAFAVLSLPGFRLLDVVEGV